MEQPSESLHHPSAGCSVNAAQHRTPLSEVCNFFLWIWRHVLRSCLYTSTIIDCLSIIPYSLSTIFDILSILVDTKTFCGSVFPGKKQLGHADYHRICGWVLLSSPTQRGCGGGREMYLTAHAISRGAVSHGLVQCHSADAIQSGRNDPKGSGKNRRRITPNNKRDRGQQVFAFLGGCIQDSSGFRLFGR